MAEAERDGAVDSSTEVQDTEGMETAAMAKPMATRMRGLGELGEVDPLGRPADDVADLSPTDPLALTRIGPD